LDCTGGDIYGERGARAYNGGLGAEQSPSGVAGVRGQSSPEADSILAFERYKKAANLPLCLYFEMPVHYFMLSSHHSRSLFSSFLY